MNPRWRKISGDLREHPAQAFLVGIAILVSTAAIMTALGAEAILTREVDASFRAGRPAAVVIWLDHVDDALVAAARTQPGVTDAEARRLVRARAEVAPGDWRTLLIFGIRDFRDLRVSVFRSESGAWPPPDGAALVERSALPVLQTPPGTTLQLRVPGGTRVTLPIAGVVHDPGLAPGWQDNAGYLYVSPATLAQLGQGDTLDELRLTIAPDAGRDTAAIVAANMTSWLAAQGRQVERVEVPVLAHPHADHMQTLLLLLKIFSALALVLCGALVANMMTGLLARQVCQIGMMKAIGGTSRQVAGIYVGLIGIIVTVSVALGLPLGLLIARAFSAFTVEQLNLEVSSWLIPVSTLVLVIFLSAGWPLLVAVVPIFSATRMTARAAISHIGLTPPTRVRQGWLVQRIGGDRTTTLALRNTFRRPGRLALSLGALAVGGAMLMTAVNVYTGLLAAVDRTLDARGDDIDVRLLGPAPAPELVALTASIPGVRVGARACSH